MDQNNGLEANISKEENRTTQTMDLREIPPQLIRISPRPKLHIWQQQSE